MFLEICLVLVLTIGVAGLFWFMVNQSSQKIRRQYQQMALQMKVSMTEAKPQLAGFIRPEPFLHGIYRRREISISVLGKGLQNTRQIETIAKVKVNESSFTWQMVATGLLGGVRQRDSGAKARWMSGDPLFDAAVDIRTNDEDRLSRIFYDTRREAILAILKGSKGTLKLENGVLYYAEFGLIADDLKRQRFIQITDVLCDFAEIVEGR